LYGWILQAPIAPRSDKSVRENASRNVANLSRSLVSPAATTVFIVIIFTAIVIAIAPVEPRNHNTTNAVMRPDYSGRIYLLSEDTQWH